MEPANDTWTQTHDLALIFIALAYGTDRALDDKEIVTITDSLRSWTTDSSERGVREIVVEAAAVFLAGDADDEVSRSMHSIKLAFNLDQRRKAFEDLMRIAEADGVVRNSEHNLLAVLADLWEIRPTSERLMEESQAAFEKEPEWSLLHDLALLFIVVGHSAEDGLSSPVIRSIKERLHDWQKELPQDELEQILVMALKSYAAVPTVEDLRNSAMAVLDHFSRPHRLGLLDDLNFIATVDGPMNDRQRDLVELLAQIWKVDIHLDITPNESEG